jgi:membrane protease YdiL (CAAX protease family)
MKQVQRQAEQSLDWVALIAAVATGVIFLAATARGPNVYFTLGAFVFWVAFVAWRAHRDKQALRNWGFRGDNLLAAARVPAALFVLAALAFAAYAFAKHRFQFPAHILPLFLLYPPWAVIQQFLVLGILVGNLEKIDALRRRPILLVIIGSFVFGAIHLSHPFLIVGTTLLALVYVPHFLKYRNVWPLGVVHGWIGPLFYLWVLGRDVWTENCCPDFVTRYLTISWAHFALPFILKICAMGGE